MKELEILQRIDDIEREIASLPQGSITTKRVKGNEYYYHRITIDKKRREFYIDFEQVEELRSKIERRKELETELKALKKSMPAMKPVKANKQDNYEFSTYIRIGEQLKNLSRPVMNYKNLLRKVNCFFLAGFFFSLHHKQADVVDLEPVFTDFRNKLPSLLRNIFSGICSMLQSSPPSWPCLHLLSSA